MFLVVAQVYEGTHLMLGSRGEFRSGDTCSHCKKVARGNPEIARIMTRMTNGGPGESRRLGT